MTSAMPVRDNPLSWFALTVKPQHEGKTAAALRNKGLEDFLPLYRARHHWSDRVKELQLPLFPGYVFSRFSLNDQLRVLTVPGILRIVGFGKHPTPVPESEITAVRTMVASGLPLYPWPFLKVGQHVYIDHGPLRGLEGILLQFRNTWRVVLSINLLQRSVAVEVDRDCLSPGRSIPPPALLPPHLRPAT